MALGPDVGREQERNKPEAFCLPRSLANYPSPAQRSHGHTGSVTWSYLTLGSCKSDTHSVDTVLWVVSVDLFLNQPFEVRPSLQMLTRAAATAPSGCDPKGSAGTVRCCSIRMQLEPEQVMLRRRVSAHRPVLCPEPAKCRGSGRRRSVGAGCSSGNGPAAWEPSKPSIPRVQLALEKVKIPTALQ